MRFRLVEMGVEHRKKSSFVRGREQGFREQARRIQFFQRQVAAAVFQVRRQVAQDVHQLQALAEPDAVNDELGLVHPRFRKQMRAADFRPELADAAGDAISVIVQLRRRFERNDVFGGRPGKTAQIQFLPACDGRKDIADQFLILRGKILQRRQAVPGLFQQ